MCWCPPVLEQRTPEGHITRIIFVCNDDMVQVPEALYRCKDCVWWQVCATLAVVAYTVMAFAGVSGPAAIVLGGGLALSSTAVAMQVLLPVNCCLPS